jgi:predicted RNA-binding Zn-ribbon protein involved in translation (DUF1610 family)
LIDPETASLDLLDAIMSTCSDVWGGRLSPIVPVIKGEISPPYWQLLRSVDPDWIYSYTSVPQGLVDRLASEIAPIKLAKHSDHLLKGQHPHYSPSISDQLVRVHALLPMATEPRWFQAPVLVTHGGKGKADPLIRRNFGLLRNDVVSEQIAKEIQQLRIDDSIDFAGFIELVSGHAGGLIFPHAAACARAICNTGTDTHGGTYNLFVGESLSDWLAFWNHIFTVAPGTRANWHALCLPVHALSHPRTIEALGKFLRRFAYRGGQNPPYLDLISSALSENELRSLAAPLMARKVDAIFRFSRHQEWSLSDSATRDRLGFGFGGGGFGQPEVLGATAHQIANRGGLVDLPSLPFQVRNDDRWIRDVHIEYRAEQPYYGNEELAYQLPRKNLLAAAFCALPGRIDADGGLSVEMRPKAPLFLTIPEDRNLILSAIGCGRRIRYTGDFGWMEQSPVFEDHGLSDKARYCRGVLNLFGGLQSAHQMFENRFWRRNIYRLANVQKTAARDKDSPLFRKLSKHPHLWAINPDANLDDELHRLEAQIVKFARSVRSSEAEITYRFLVEDFRKERAESVAENPHLAPKNEEEAKHSAEEAEGRLKHMLQGLVDSKIFQQGIVARCRQCGSRIWRELGSIKQQFECPGCGASVLSPVEPTWYYRLNSLVSKAISEHGTVALINALAAAREKARNSFIFNPGFVFYVHYDDKDPVSEVDAICLVDGELWTGEVKSNASEFTQSVMSKLIADGKKLGADKAFVFAQEGNQDALRRHCETSSAAGDIEIIHLCPSGFAAQPSYHV